VGSVTVDVTIQYSSDPLYRLTGADYSDGDSYYSVGNRLEQETRVKGLISTTEYTYDHANRLTSVSNQTLASGYPFNGLGDRLQQTVDEVTTTYVNDLNAGLTQVLSDGMNQYLYGNGRIAQDDSVNMGYFLGDALGSVRQLADGTGEVVLGRSYDPYGVTVEDVAVIGVQTTYGFTNEYTDSYFKLINLRSRVYGPSTGTFLTRDSWQGDFYRPLSLNRWMYGYSNPVKFTDPSGYSAIGNSIESILQSIPEMTPPLLQLQMILASGCPNNLPVIPDSSGYAFVLRNVYNVNLINWERSASGKTNEQSILLQVTEISNRLWDVYSSMADKATLFRAVFGPVTIQQNYGDDDQDPPCITRSDGENYKIDCYSLVNNDLQEFIWTGMIIHEFGHIFDNRIGNGASLDLYNDTELTSIIGGGIDPITGNWRRVVEGYQGSGEAKPFVQHYVSDPSGTAYNEDFADMFMNWVETGQLLYNHQDNTTYRLGFSSDIAGNARYNWINQRMVGWIQEAIH
jgi:RHS repeat-associated protein